ncbi:insulinase family protein [Orrella sp. NBD-18]|uniref:Insulinase family protein n=1 Tax=Sheuella amnicola TaxID=2707330 RepID=A0A6B2QZY1_9BURK|nr:pitrilysin family protein [Sheuella amnicola]NDY82874.1 insulinase family protein [Sheuella amnicola]
MRLLLRAFLGITFAFLASQSWAFAPPAGIKEITSVEGISEYTLESNGLRILLAPDDSKPTTTVNMTYLVGSRHENYGETGMAHLLEHMLFKGTPTFPNALGEFSKRGLQANGSTSTDRTNYYASFAANPETLKWYLTWQADAMVNSTILRQDLDTEMTVVRNEMENGENNPFQMLWQKMLGVAFQWHNYGKTPIGARSDVENVDIDQLRAFYRTYYQPDNAVLIITGKFDPQAALQDVQQAFGKLPRPTRKIPPEYTVEPVQDGERSITLRRNGGSPMVAAMYHVPPAGHKDFAALDLASMMMADTPAGRLYKSLVPTKQATSVMGFTMDEYAPGIVMFGATLEHGMDPVRALSTLTATIEDIGKKPFTKEELERVRTQWLTGWDKVFSDAQKISSALSEYVAIGDWRMVFVARDRIRAVSLEDVQRVASEYLVSSNRTEGKYIPTEKPVRAPLPTIPDLKKDLSGYQGDGAAKQVAAFDPTPANIDARTQVKELKLPNGTVRLALLPKEARGNRVKAVLTLQSGSVESLKGQRMNAIVASELLLRGTEKLSRQQIRDKIDALKGEVSISGGAASVVIDIGTTKENIDELMSFVLAVIKDANYPQDQIDEYINKTVTGLKSAKTEPTAIASRMLSRHDNPWAKDDIRYMPTFDESIEATQAIKRSELIAFHQKFHGAGQIDVAAVGDFDPVKFETTLTQSLQSWKPAAPYQRISDPYRMVKAEQMQALTPDKANAFYLAKLPLDIQDTHPDFPALTLANFLLGSSETSRLWMRVREKEGLSYNVRSSLSVSAFEPNGTWSVYAIFAPENRKKVETAISEELARAVKDGFTEIEIKDGITALLNLRKLSLAQDPTLAVTWNAYLERKRTFAWAEQINQKIAALTPAQVHEALRKYLKPADFSSVAAGDFEKK